MNKTLAIIGSHPRTREEFDFSRADCDIWVFNEAVSGGLDWAQKATAVFQMHEEVIWRNPGNRNDPNHIKWLQKQTAIPVYMQQQFEDVPASVKYPLDEIIDRFKVRHFTSSVAYAMALAAHTGQYNRVEIYGVEMETNTEYQYQRDGVTLWIGVLLGLGIEVDAHIGMFNQPLYGYEGEVVIPYETFEKRIEELTPHILLRDQEYKQASKETEKLVDALLESDTTVEIHLALQKQLDCSQKLGLLIGAKSENLRYKKKADLMIENSETFLFSRQEFESSAKKLADQAGEAQVDVNVLSGKGTLVERQVQNAAKGSPKRKKVMAEYKDIMAQYLEAHGRAMMYTGAAKENYAYMERLDKSIRAAGGSKSEAVLLEHLKAGQNA